MEMQAELERAVPPTGANLQFASLGDRFLAVMVDSLLGVGLFFFFGFAIAGTGRSGSFQLQGGRALLLLFLVAVLLLGYFIALEALTGVTLGKLTAGIRVQTEDGTAIEWRAALERNLMRVVDVLPLFYLVGAFSFLLTQHSQRLGDRVAKTVVVPDQRQNWIRAVALAGTIAFVILAIIIGKRL
jgi:uncharacterized RDD family membrane protein YckC